MNDSQETESTETQTDEETSETKPSLINSTEETAEDETETSEETTEAEENKETEEEETLEPVTAESIKIPEGLEIDDETMGSFLETMNDAGLSPQDRAQKLIDLQTKSLQDASEKSSQAWDDLQESWVKEVKDDPNIGGAKLKGSLASIGKLVAEYGDKETTQAFDITGAGNNPHIVRFLHTVATKLTEGGSVLGNPSPEAKSTAEKMFPSMNK